MLLDMTAYIKSWIPVQPLRIGKADGALPYPLGPSIGKAVSTNNYYITLQKASNYKFRKITENPRLLFQRSEF